jgi:shikimate dehydrogenase
MAKNYRAELTGCFGDPIDGNPTGVMEEAAFAACGLNWRYMTIKVKAEDLETAFAGCKAMNFNGLNLTMPHKRNIIPLLDGMTQAAEIIGAVNTVLVRDGKYIGENTDGKGFVTALLMSGAELTGKNVTILGAGGAARAIAVECALAGAKKITIINRTETNGTELAQLIADKTPAESQYLPWTPAIAVPEGTDILINGTCVGLHPNGHEKPDINYDTITANMVVSDVVFNPVDPLFLQEARARGAKTVSGIGMLVQQGALNFTSWTGVEAPVDVMYKTLEAEFGA